MRAEAHYVDLLASRASATRERTLPISAIEAPVFDHHDAVAPLVESIREHGVLQPLLIQDRDGSYRLVAGHKRLAAAAAAGLREVPCVIYDVDDEKAEALAEASNVLALQEAPAAPPVPFAEPQAIPDTTLHAGRDLAHSLTTLTACADMLGGAQSDLAREVVANLIRAEAWRASSLLQATRVVRQELKIARTAVPAQAIVDRAVRALDPERQVRHVLVDVVSDLTRGTCLAADETLLSGALGWAAVATLALLDGVQDARLSFGATGPTDGRIAFTVSQDNVVVPETWAARAFDPEWTERLGGVPAVVSMLALQRTVNAHQGTGTVEVTSRGTRIAFSVPLGT